MARWMLLSNWSVTVCAVQPVISDQQTAAVGLVIIDCQGPAFNHINLQKGGSAASNTLWLNLLMLDISTNYSLIVFLEPLAPVFSSYLICANLAIKPEISIPVSVLISSIT